MSSLRSVFFGCVALALVAGCGPQQATWGTEEEASHSTQLVAKPPQFVLLSFDGSYNLEMWQKTAALGPSVNARLTYFVSGVFWLPYANRRSYRPPRAAAGTSLVGYGDDEADIAKRNEQANAALALNHELASHANGHFDGARWKASEWKSELDQFDAFVAPIRTRGFRAPFLANGPGLYAALSARGIAYDSSETLRASDWPTKKDGVWHVPLAALRVPRGQPNYGYLVNSSDVGFYTLHHDIVAAKQSRKYPHEVYEKEMLATYLAYFSANYDGNRAPVRIAHHFTQYYGGAYLRALEAFARQVCGLPDVRCVTFSELVAFLELHQAELAQYQAADYEPAGTEEQPLRLSPDADVDVDPAELPAELKADRCGAEEAE